MQNKFFYRYIDYTTFLRVWHHDFSHVWFRPFTEESPLTLVYMNNHWQGQANVLIPASDGHGLYRTLRQFRRLCWVRGVVTGSSSNHDQATAYVASRLGVNAVICVSARVPSSKADAIRRFGAEIVVSGKSYDESVSYALHLAEERGLTMIDSFDDPFVIAGQGTIGLELLED